MNPEGGNSEVILTFLTHAEEENEKPNSALSWVSLDIRCERRWKLVEALVDEMC
jgi:hypothetical protein